MFQKSYEEALKEYSTSQRDFIDIFVEMFNKQKKEMSMENANLRTYFGERAGIKNAKDQEIITFIKQEANDIVDRTFKILRTRIDRFGVAQPNLQRLQGGRILVELPGIKEPERVTDLLKSTAKLEFWQVYNDPVNGQSIQQRFQNADIQLAKELKAKKNLEKTNDTIIPSDSTLANIDSNAKNEEMAEDVGAIISKAVVGSDGIVIGYFKEADMKEIDNLLPSLQRILGDKSVVFYWGSAEKQFKNAYPLIPLKKNNDRIGPILSSETINGARVVRSARQDIDQNNRTVVTMSMEDQATKSEKKSQKLP